MTATLTPTLPARHRVVSQDEWNKERIALLAKEKELTRQHDEIASQIRDLPWVKVEKTYTFDGPNGKVSLGELFGERNQLMIYHFMFDPTWSQGCKSCSFIADHYNGIVIHLAHRDISFVTVSKAPLDKLLAFRKRMGWTFPWVSSGDSDFGHDFGVSFTDQELSSEGTLYNFNRAPYPIRELPGITVFARDAEGNIYRTYSAYARGLDQFIAAYQFIDITPKGRDEAQAPSMGWLRHHDRYGEANFVDPWLEQPGITGPAAT